MISLTGATQPISFPTTSDMQLPSDRPLTAKEKVILAREKKNEGLKHVSLEMETSTHFPMLIKCVNKSRGAVLELGSGLFSTPLLHWLCFPNRKLITCESYQHYMDFAKKFATKSHTVKFIEDWNHSQILQGCGCTHFGVVLIDHSPKKPRQRGDDAILFKDAADYVVLHDAGKNSNPKYGYEKVFEHFKYRYDWEGCWPPTTVLSNYHDLTDFGT